MILQRMPGTCCLMLVLPTLC